MLNVLHIMLCFMLIVCVLLQKGKGAQAGAGVAMGASQTTFGSSGSAGFLYRATQYTAFGLMLICILIARFEHQIYIESIKSVDVGLPYLEKGIDEVSKEAALDEVSKEAALDSDAVALSKTEL